jgi:hypothetical protein
MASSFLNVSTYICTLLCIHTHKHIHAYKHIHIQTDTHTYIYTLIRTHTQTHNHNHTHTYIHTHTHTHIYIYVHALTHTYKETFKYIHVFFFLSFHAKCTTYISRYICDLIISIHYMKLFPISHFTEMCVIYVNVDKINTLSRFIAVCSDVMI